MSTEQLTELQQLANALRDAQGRLNSVRSLNWDRLDGVDNDRLGSAITIVHQTARALERLAPETEAAA